ncbi:MAG: hypothetical protein QW450_00055 [Candidatus Nitrosocaldus sp.]
MKVVVYGLSTEGYNIAKSLSLKGFDVSMVDESKGMAVSIRAEMAMAYSSVNALMEDEPLLGLEPEGIAIASADYIFFTPKIRKVAHDAKVEIAGKFRSMINHLGKDSSIIYCIPTGIGGNKEVMEVLEHVTNMKVNEDINYYYMPIATDALGYVIGSTSIMREDQGIYRIIECVTDGSKISMMDIQSAEILYSNRVLSHYIPLITAFELCKNISEDTRSILREEEGLRELFIDDVASSLFDLYMLANSIESATLAHIINNCIRSLEAYSKHIVDEVRLLLKKKDLRASKCKIVIAWSIDSNEMRSSRTAMLSLLSSRLRDYVGDVDMLKGTSLLEVYDERTLVILACSRADYERIKDYMDKVKSIGRDSIIVVKANPLCEVID